MNLRIRNNTDRDLTEINQLVSDFYPYAQERFGFNTAPTLTLQSDPANAADPMGKTGAYNPDTQEITVYVDQRHPKDILRSFSHELVHHAQNCRGEFANEVPTSEGYAQTSEHLREMEKEAYLQGQLCLRDYGDNKMNERTEKVIREAINKSIKRILQERTTPPVDPTATYVRADDVEITEDSGREEGKHYKRNEWKDEDHIKAIQHHLDALKDDEHYDRDHVHEDSGEEESEHERENVEDDEEHIDALDKDIEDDEKHIQPEAEIPLKEWKRKTVNQLLMEKWCK